MGVVVGGTGKETEQSTLRLFWKNMYDLQMNNYCDTFLLPFLIVALNDGYIYNRCGVVGSSVEMFHDWYSRKSFGFKSKLMLVQKLKRIFIH